MVSMKQYLLDTNICVFLLRGQYDIDKKLDKIGLEHCYISEITEAELKYGAELGRRKGLKQRIEQLDEFLSALKILPISNAIIPIISSRPSPRKEEGGTLVFRPAKVLEVIFDRLENKRNDGKYIQVSDKFRNFAK